MQFFRSPTILKWPISGLSIASFSGQLKTSFAAVLWSVALALIKSWYLMPILRDRMGVASAAQEILIIGFHWEIRPSSRVKFSFICFNFFYSSIISRSESSSCDDTPHTFSPLCWEPLSLVCGCSHRTVAQHGVSPLQLCALCNSYGRNCIANPISGRNSANCGAGASESQGEGGVGTARQPQAFLQLTCCRSRRGAPYSYRRWANMGNRHLGPRWKASSHSGSHRTWWVATQTDYFSLCQNSEPSWESFCTD